MAAKATTNTYRQPIPTQNCFSYNVLIQRYTPFIQKYGFQIKGGRLRSCRDRHTESISADTKREATVSSSWALPGGMRVALEYK